MSNPQIIRLGRADNSRAREAFTMLAEVFEQEHAPLSEGYLDRVLSRPDFWAVVAVIDDRVVGCLTAHTLMMTTAEVSEVFLYDIAVRPEHQRAGIGRRLVEALREGARAVGIDTVFVPADDEDLHALDFYRALGGSPAPVTIFTFER
jgi:aminoglycoside 3-N-acetyltransferase I